MPGTFFGQYALDEDNSQLFWVNSKGIFNTGPGFQGNCPQGTMISQGDGTFWGTSGGFGGAGIIYYGTPTVALYKADIRGGYAPVYNFTFDQGQSFNRLTVARGCLYGSAITGGVPNSKNSGGDGTIFKITPGYNVIMLRQLDRTISTPEAGLPTGPLFLASDGNLYGTSLRGGPKDGGTVYKLDAKDRFFVVHSFIGTDGQAPFGGLVQGRNGVLYGTTYEGGKSGKGIVFGVTTGGKFTTIHTFGDGSVANDGTHPVAGLTLGPDGSLYGTTEVGGKYGNGTVYRISPSGTETIVHAFGTSTSDGINPCGLLTVGLDGNLYGSTAWGGQNNNGTVFKVVVQTPPSVKLSISPSTLTVAAGNHIVYNITCTNLGKVAAYDVSINAIVPAHTQLVDQGAGSNQWSLSNGHLTGSIGSLLPGQSVVSSFAVSVGLTTPAGTKLVSSVSGTFTAGTIPTSATSVVTVTSHGSKNLGYSVQNGDSKILQGSGTGSSPVSPVSGKIQFANKLGVLWLNVDLSNNGTQSSWKASGSVSQILSQLQLLPPNQNPATLIGTFSRADDSLTVLASPYSGGLGLAGTMNAMQLFDLLPLGGADMSRPGVALAIPVFIQLPDFASASNAFNQSLLDYSHSNWTALNTDLQAMSVSLIALSNNPTELSAFEGNLAALNPGLPAQLVKSRILNASGITDLGALYLARPMMVADLLAYARSADLHQGGVSSTFFAVP